MARSSVARRALAGRGQACRRISNCRDAMLACNVYISEGRDDAVIKSLEEVANSSEGVAKLNVFVDGPYNRTGITLASPEPAPAAAQLARAACARLDLTSHRATHPRIGVVDHIACHPLGAGTSIDCAAQLALQICQHLSRDDGIQGSGWASSTLRAVERGARTHCGESHAGMSAWSEGQGIPCLVYGAAHPSGRSLVAIRRAYGYFRADEQVGRWSGSSLPARIPCSFEPDYGPQAISPRTGIVAVGATPWVVNYNVLLHTGDLASARKVARAVSATGGGLPYVQTMALVHNTGVEVACNILNATQVPESAVLTAVTEAAECHGIAISKAYRIGPSQEELMQQAVKMLGASRH